MATHREGDHLMRRLKLIFTAAALAAGLSVSCLAADVPAAVSAAVADSARPAADTVRDANRKPAETLAFADIKPGSEIAELMPGGGYFTRLLSVATGPSGHVYALAPPPRPNGPNPMPAIAADAHYGNITLLPLSYTAHALGLPEPVDVVWTSDNYHDMHNDLDSAGMQDFDRHVLEALKPGGMFIVVDHAAAPGRGASDTHTLHRIDVETVKTEVTAAGFKLAGSSDVLHNPNDPHTARIFDPSIRGRTDQFILKFVKP
jgi:predicted methyltransferase